MNNIVVDIDLDNTLIYKNNILLLNEANLIETKNNKIIKYGSTNILNKNSFNPLISNDYNLYLIFLKKLLLKYKFNSKIIISSYSKDLYEYLKKNYKKKKVFVVNKLLLEAAGSNMDITKASLNMLISVNKTDTKVCCISLGQVVKEYSINIGSINIDKKIHDKLLKKYKTEYDSLLIEKIKKLDKIDNIKNKDIITILNSSYLELTKEIYKYINSNKDIKDIIKDKGIIISGKYIDYYGLIEKLNKILNITVIKSENYLDAIKNGGYYLLNNINLIKN